jgi:hypothetical protein
MTGWAAETKAIPIPVQYFIFSAQPGPILLTAHCNLPTIHLFVHRYITDISVDLNRLYSIIEIRELVNKN